MTSPRKDKIVIAEHGVITEEALMAYLNETLSPEQRHELERLLKDDPFAQDALEGLRATQDKNAVKTSLSSVQKKVRERSGGNKKGTAVVVPMHWSTYAYAAVIVGLLVSVGFILTTYLSKKDDTVAMETPQQQKVAEPEQKTEQPAFSPAEQAKDTVTTNTITTTPSTSGADNNEVANNGLKNNGEVTVTNGNKVGGTYGFSTTNTATDKNEVAESGKKGSKPASGSVSVSDVTMNSTLTTSSNYSAAPAASDANAPKAASKTEEPKAKDDTNKPTLDEAMKSFNSGDYKTAATQFDGVLKEQPDNPEALFFGGVSDYVQNDLKASEKSFDKLLKKGTKFVDGSKWYKANILLKKGKKEEAKKLLEELSNTNGSYTERAKKKLADGGL